jgi:ubiquinone/menaquinone biosynthesis C-methylase UbiE
LLVLLHGNSAFVAVGKLEMTAISVADKINRRTMRDSVREYSVYDGLNTTEQKVFADLAGEVKDKSILDLGVGGGRTTSALLQISDDYVGVDYTQEMIDVCRSRFPGVRFEHADARSMPQYLDRSFKLIVFTCNGISMVDHAGRIAIFNEVRRLLAVDGVFVFSTYNSNSDEYERRFEFPEFEPSMNPARLVVRAARFALHTAFRLVNRLRYLRHEVRTDEYSIINDRCHHYATMLYYLSMENQLKQLKAAGFDNVPTVYDIEGRVAEPNERSDSLTYVVRA